MLREIPPTFTVRLPAYCLESTHEYCPCAPVALMVPRIHKVTHSYAKVIVIPGVSRCAGSGLMVVLAAITPGRAGLLVPVFEDVRRG